MRYLVRENAIIINERCQNIRIVIEQKNIKYDRHNLLLSNLLWNMRLKATRNLQQMTLLGWKSFEPFIEIRII